MDQVRVSKILSYWLRHAPEAAGLTLDAAGWAAVDPLLEALRRELPEMTWDGLVQVVELSDKQRFELSADGERIRARQGHSVDVTLDWPKTKPPAVLYHGTVDRFLPAILAEGLKPMRRHHVHLSPDVETARKVGGRRGKPVILAIAPDDMEDADFFLTANGVWLTARVPPDALRVQREALGILWLHPWEPIDYQAWGEQRAADYRLAWEAQLATEVGPNHVLFGQIAKLIARRFDTDDALFELADGRVADVHLTWANGVERDPRWPNTGVHASLQDWSREIMIADHKDWFGVSGDV